MLDESSAEERSAIQQAFLFAGVLYGTCEVVAACLGAAYRHIDSDWRGARDVIGIGSKFVVGICIAIVCVDAVRGRCTIRRVRNVAAAGALITFATLVWYSFELSSSPYYSGWRLFILMVESSTSGLSVQILPIALWLACLLDGSSRMRVSPNRLVLFAALSVPALNVAGFVAARGYSGSVAESMRSLSYALTMPNGIAWLAHSVLDAIALALCLVGALRLRRTAPAWPFVVAAGATCIGLAGHMATNLLNVPATSAQVRPAWMSVMVVLLLPLIAIAPMLPAAIVAKLKRRRGLRPDAYSLSSMNLDSVIANSSARSTIQS